MTRLCGDLVVHIASFLDDPFDLLHYDEVFGILRSLQDMRAVCPTISKLVWHYVDPPLVWAFSVSNVIEVQSLEPEYNYRSFLLTSFTKCPATIMPHARTINGRKLLHVHESWIVRSLP